MLRGVVLFLLLAQSAAFPDPKRELRHIIPWGAGGATDTAMRGFARHLEKHLGIPVVTENIPGALSAVGLLQVKRARPDGYTVVTLTYDALTLSVQGLAPVRWDDFEPLGMVTEHASALIVASDRFEDVGSLQKAALAEPGRVKVGNVGTGGIWHQHAVAMERALGVRLTHVPYEAGSGAQLTALLGGEVDANVSSLPAALPYVRAGQLRVLAVMAEDRDPLVPEVRTFRELGYDLVFSGFRILAAPHGTPPDVRTVLEDAMRRAFEDPSFRDWADRAVIGARFRNAADTRRYLELTAAKVEALMAELGLGGTR
ncbi:MAG TPA: tripartite tricarboxylate transporter substrate binding protein [Vicinamibacteria bacterium]|nr:tripartite tricarboxylate transporter substrate binding protein [Vicinamibacteria bacterium]